MGRQYNKVEHKQRRKAYIKRKKAAIKVKTTAAKTAAKNGRMTLLRSVPQLPRAASSCTEVSRVDPRGAAANQNPSEFEPRPHQDLRLPDE